MVWGLLPEDSLSGEEKYYIFRKGTYKVGRKGCDIIITKDKGVSRIHAEIVVNEMSSSAQVLIRDFSKYGTFINKNLGSQKKVHEFPNKETTLKDGDLVSFGTGNATYRFCFVTLLLYACCSKSTPSGHLLGEKVSSIGGLATDNYKECTHVLVDEFAQVKESLLDAVVAKKPLVLSSWLEYIAEQSVRNDIPGCSLHIPTVVVQGVSVKVVEPKTRETCLEGNTFLLEPMQTYKFKDRLEMLLDVAGAKIVSVEEFRSSSQSAEIDNNRVVYVVSGESDSNRFSKLNRLYQVNEMDLVCAILSGHLDTSSLTPPPVVVSSSCSTAETVVADSEAEDETATSACAASALHLEEITAPIYEGKVAVNDAAAESENGCATSNRCREDETMVRCNKVQESAEGTSDIIYSQDLIVKDANTTALTSVDTSEVNFKRFRKTNTASGNSFSNLIPFAKYPYKDSEYGSDQLEESMREEKKRKQMEAMAEDLFNNDKGRRRGAAGSLRGLFAQS